MNIRAAIFTACVALSSVVGCAVQGDESSPEQQQSEGLTIESMDAERGVVARWTAGSTKLVFRTRIADGKAVGEVIDGAGLRLSTVSVPVGGQLAAMRPLLEEGAADSLGALAPIANDPVAVKTLITAYRAATTALTAKLPATLPKEMVWSLQMQTSVLSFALLHVNPKSMLQIAPPPQNVKKTGYMAAEEPATADEGSSSYSGESAPNDDNEDYNAEPTTWQEYDENGNAVGGTASEDPYRWAVYGGRCNGACGPGCDWCIGLSNGRHLCQTNAFCYLHDRHCGAWEHFFDCSWKAQF